MGKTIGVRVEKRNGNDCCRFERAKRVWRAPEDTSINGYFLSRLRVATETTDRRNLGKSAIVA